MINRKMFSYSKKITVKTKSNLSDPLSQGNQLPISCMSFQKWFMHAQTLCLNAFPTEKQMMLSDTLEEQRSFLSL